MNVLSYLRPLAIWIALLAAGPLLLAVAGPLPFLTPSNLVLLAIDALAAVGLTLVMGFAGQVSLGQAAFAGVGAYAVAILAGEEGWSPWLAVPAGLLASGLLATLLGVLVFRIRGHFLAMATLAFGLVFHSVLKSAEGVTGGNGGLGGIPPLAVGPWRMVEDRTAFLVAWGVLAAGLLIARNIVNSPTGRALRAVGASEAAAGCCGVDVARAKVAVFVVGALYASLAGSLYALYVTYVSPDSFGVLLSVELLVIATVGGLGSVWGAPLGAAFLVLAAELARENVPRVVDGATGSYEIVVYGLALVIVLLTFDRGIAGGVNGRGAAPRLWIGAIRRDDRRARIAPVRRRKAET